MRTIKLVFLLVFVCGILSTFQAKSQAEIFFDNTVIFKDGKGEVYNSVSSKTTFTCSGNIVKSATFQLPQDHYLVPKKGKNYIATRIIEIDKLGNEVMMYDFNVAIDKSGKFKINYHSNGAGTVFPLNYN